MKTVLGNISAKEINAALCHEHICCYSEYLNMMSGRDYLNLSRLEEKAVAELGELKLKYGLNLFVDCTPINIGRNIELLKRVSEKSGVHIVCSTGFYYNDEPVLYASSAEILAEHMIKDAKNINADIIKAAAENEALSDFSLLKKTSLTELKEMYSSAPVSSQVLIIDGISYTVVSHYAGDKDINKVVRSIAFNNIKLLTAAAIAQKELDLPIVAHTNANNRNGLKVLEVLLEKGVKPEKITIGHLNDTENMDYILEIAKSGCYIGLDRMYDNKSEEYISKKVNAVLRLCEAGFEDKILLSHDESFFNGFEAIPVMKENTRFSYVFEHIKPKLPKELFEKIIRHNPINMLGL